MIIHVYFARFNISRKCHFAPQNLRIERSCASSPARSNNVPCLLTFDPIVSRARLYNRKDRVQDQLDDNPVKHSLPIPKALITFAVALLTHAARLWHGYKGTLHGFDTRTRLGKPGGIGMVVFVEVANEGRDLVGAQFTNVWINLALPLSCPLMHAQQLSLHRERGHRGVKWDGRTQKYKNAL